MYININSNTTANCKIIKILAKNMKIIGMQCFFDPQRTLPISILKKHPRQEYHKNLSVLRSVFFYLKIHNILLYNILLKHEISYNNIKI